MPLVTSGPGLLAVAVAVVAVGALALGACTTSPISPPPATVVEPAAAGGSEAVSPSPLQIPTPAGTFEAITAGPPAGRKVMLLHGFAELGREWEHQVAALGAAGYRAVAPDQRGYSPGVRPARVEDYALDRMVEDVFAMADALGWERFDLVGHDWGAVVGWIAAAEGAERVRSYTAVSVPHIGAFADALRNDPQQQRMSVYMDQFWQPPDGPERALLASGPPNLPGVAREKSEYYYARLSEPGALTAALNWYRANRFDGRYAPVEVPTLLIVGAEDEMVAPSGITATANWVTGPYRLERLAGVGHFAPEQAPQAVTNLLLDHLVRHPN